MDTDVEVVKSLNKYLEHEAFSGFEDGVSISTGIMACRKDYPLFLELLSYYDDVAFIKEDGTLNYTTNVTIITELCLKHGFKQNNEYQVINGFALYPKDVFCPLDYASGIMKKTRQTTTIHWFSASWHSPEQQKQRSEHRKQLKRQQNRERIDYIMHTPNRIGMVLLGRERYCNLSPRLNLHIRSHPPLPRGDGCRDFGSVRVLSLPPPFFVKIVLYCRCFAGRFGLIIITRPVFHEFYCADLNFSWKN